MQVITANYGSTTSNQSSETCCSILNRMLLTVRDINLVLMPFPSCIYCYVIMFFLLHSYPLALETQVLGPLLPYFLRLSLVALSHR